MLASLFYRVSAPHLTEIYPYLFFYFFTQDKKGQVVSTDTFIKQVGVLDKGRGKFKNFLDVRAQMTTSHFCSPIGRCAFTVLVMDITFVWHEIFVCSVFSSAN